MKNELRSNLLMVSFVSEWTLVFKQQVFHLKFLFYDNPWDLQYVILVLNQSK